MSFASPDVLLALLAIPVAIVLYVLHARRRAAVAARFGNPDLWPNAVARSPGWRRHLPFAILLIALATMLVGAARPSATVSQRRQEATVVLAVDVSRSMTANDVRPSRLAAARSSAEAFLGRVPSRYRIGVVGFGSRAVVAVPPTTNRALATTALDSLRPGEGTALGDAVALSAQIGRSSKGSGGISPPAAVLVISDGARQGGRTSIKAAIARAKALHVPVYAVLVGTQNGTVTATLTGGFKETIKVPPSPGTLRQIVTATGGRLFTATNAAGLHDVYDSLTSRLGHVRRKREITDLFAGGAALLLLAGGALSLLWFRSVP